ncbi:MAG TPA: hypothetical protein PLG17_05360, partial [Thermodesulfobacteriota bacterium]|nr:hypothetical protein [Thermodesulfobacteriota bacterium]
MITLILKRCSSICLVIGTWLVGYALLLPTALADPRVPWSAETVDFVLKANDEFISYRIMSISVLPGGTIELETLQEGVPCPGTIIAPAGELVQYLPSRW